VAPPRKNEGEDGITKRGKSWRVRIVVGGRRYCEKFPTLELARIGRDKFRSDMSVYFAQIAAGIRPSLESLGPPPMPLAELTAKFLLHQRQNVRDASYDFYQREMQVLLKHCGNPLIPTTKITSAWLQDYFNRQLVRRSDNDGKPIKRSTVAIHRRAVSRLFSWAADLDHIKANPMVKVARIKVPKDIDRPTFSPLEIKAFLGALKSASTSVRAFFTVLIYTGLRRSEMMRMQWSWINLEARCLTVHKPKNDTPRMITLAAPAVDALTALPEREGHVWRDHQTDQPLSRPPYGRLKVILKRAGLSLRGFHAFRRFFCTESLEAGVALEVVQDLAGHSDPRLTRLYGKTSDERRRLGIEALTERVKATTNVIPMPKVGTK
jgi:integrase